jgi:hypothetical protein
MCSEVASDAGSVDDSDGGGNSGDSGKSGD